ncbi:lactoylglutathione lyase [Pseudomonas defluvii]|nr:lactoylglutathione lyase [Pseudomonas defluvii]
MLRVLDLERSLAFYRDLLGMTVLRHNEYESGRFTNVFLSFNEETQSSLELTYNWDQHELYEKGQAFGHLALMVNDIQQAVKTLEQSGVKIKTPPKQMNHGKRTIAFIFDPDEYLIELIEPL